MEGALRNHPDYVKDLSDIGVDINRFSLKHAVSDRRKGKRDPVKGGLTGESSDSPEGVVHESD